MAIPAEDPTQSPLTVIAVCRAAFLGFGVLVGPGTFALLGQAGAR
jgi:hypothetical protein